MKQVLFIDFHGTLCNDYFWRSLDSEARKKIGHMLFTEPSLATRDWMKGVYTSEEINKMVAERLDLPFESLWSTFVEDCKHMTVSPEVLLQIKTLRNKFTTILLTDNMDCFSRFVVPSLRLDSYFEYIANSSDEKILKNENNGEAFLRHIARLNANIEGSILIDDSVSVCNLFRGLGGTSYTVTQKENLGFWLTTLQKN
jgi:hypothetical protein